MAIFDSHGRLLYGNQALAAFLGLDSRSERFRSILEHPPAHLKIADSEGRPVPWTEIPLARALRGEGEPARLLRIRDLRAGTEEWASMRAVPIRTVRGELALVAVTIHDVTEITSS